MGTCRARRLATLGAGLVLLAALPASAAGYALEDWLANESGWKDFGVGTTTLVRKTSTMDIPGMPVPRKVVHEERRTLTGKSETTAIINVERRVGAKKWEGLDVKEPLQAAERGKATIVRDAEQRPVVEAVRIGGKDYACTKYDGERSVGDVKERALLWVHEKLGVLKYEGGRGPGVRVTWTVVRLGIKRTIGDLTLEARELALKAGDSTGTLVVSAEVPGFVVEEVLHFRDGATKTTTKRELIAFTKK